MGVSNVINEISKSNGIHLEWKFQANELSSVVNEALEFINNGKIIKTYTRTIWNQKNQTGILSNELILFPSGEDLTMCLDTKDTSFLPLGESIYNLIILGVDNEEIPKIIFETSGKVLVHE